MDPSYATILVNGQDVKLEIESRSDTIVEPTDPNNIVFFCDIDMGKFKLQPAQPFLQNIDPISNEIQDDQGGLLHMYFDGACSKEGSKVGVIFIVPGEKLLNNIFN